MRTRRGGLFALVIALGSRRKTPSKPKKTTARLRVQLCTNRPCYRSEKSTRLNLALVFSFSSEERVSHPRWKDDQPRLARLRSVVAGQLEHADWPGCEGRHPSPVHS